MTFVILFVLAIAWAWYLLTWYSGRREQRNVNSISSFSKHLSVLERTSPSNAGMATVGVRPAGPARAAGTYAPRHGAMTRSQAQIRRQQVVLGLGIASLAAVLGAWALGGLFGYLAAAVLVASVGYVGLLVRSNALTTERTEKVHYLQVADDVDADWDAWDDWDDEAYDEAYDDYAYTPARLAR